MTEFTGNTTNFPSRLTWFGVGLILFCSYILYFLLQDVSSVPDDPQVMGLPTAVQQASDERMYVQLQGGQWDCDSITYVRTPRANNRSASTDTEVFLTSDDGSVVAFVRLSGEQTCADLNATTPQGYLTLLDSDKQQELTNEVRLAKYIAATDYLELCGYCSPNNSRLGIIISSIMGLMGVGLIGLDWKNGRS
ncbi:MAG: hypothetical protein H6658_06355 [Ardenticatenaceae bacterium]|nr:hypothetical protein [Ardenticatenaceae bacterium]